MTPPTAKGAATSPFEWGGRLVVIVVEIIRGSAFHRFSSSLSLITLSSPFKWGGAPVIRGEGVMSNDSGAHDPSDRVRRGHLPIWMGRKARCDRRRNHFVALRSASYSSRA